MPHEENRRRSPKEYQRSKPTTIATLPWGPLEHQKGLFHPLCLAASKALHMKRSSLRNNSVYNPLGLVFPVILEGKLILQQLVIMQKKVNRNDPLGWDDPLPKNMKHCCS